MKQIDWKFWLARHGLPPAASVIFTGKQAAPILPHESIISAEDKQKLLGKIATRYASVGKAAGTL